MTRQGENGQSTWTSVIGFGLLAAALIATAGLWPTALTSTGIPGGLPFKGTEDNALQLHPFAELLKLVLAALIGIIVTTVHRRYHRDKPLPRSLLQAQVLLCVAGAIIMVIIGSSVARAFGVAGAAGIVRFRTPVEDPKDTTLLFLLVALGMACGVGLLEVAGLGTAFICLVLVVLDRFGDAKLRVMVLTVVSTSKDFPTDHVTRILGSSVDQFEVREMQHDNETTIKYTVGLAAATPIAWITQELISGGTAGLKSVSWSEPSKKSG